MKLLGCRAAWLTTVIGIVFAGYAQGQTAEEIRQYVVENELSLMEAAVDLRMEFQEVAELLGYESFVEASTRLGLLFVTCIEPVVDLKGTAESLGLSDTNLLDHVKLRLRNDLRSLPLCDLAAATPEARPMMLLFTVWTVGDQYPIAYHVEVWTGLMLGPAGFDTPYRGAVLGVSNAAAMAGLAEQVIEETVHDLAIAYLRAIGHW